MGIHQLDEFFELCRDSRRSAHLSLLIAGTIISACGLTLLRLLGALRVKTGQPNRVSLQADPVGALRPFGGE